MREEEPEVLHVGGHETKQESKKPADLVTIS
jgi:hypothetical protein